MCLELKKETASEGFQVASFKAQQVISALE